MPVNGYQAGSVWPNSRGQVSNSNTGLSSYVGSSSNQLSWTFATGGSISSSPTIDALGTVYFGSSDYSFYALSSSSGSFKWKYKTGGPIQYSSAAVGSDGTLYIGSDDYYLYAFQSWGSMKWRYKTGMWVRASPIIGPDGTLYVGSMDFSMYAISSSGTKKWSYKTGFGIYSQAAMNANNTMIYFGCDDNYVYSLTTTGTLKWKYNTGNQATTSPAVGSNGHIFIGSDSSYFYSLTAAGTLLWKFLTGSWVTSSAAIAVDGTIYVGSDDNYTRAISPSGTLKWAFDTGDYVVSSPVIGADGTIYFGSDDKYLYAVSSFGSLVWKFGTGGMVESSPVIGSDGTVFVGSDDGSLYAISGFLVSMSPSLFPTSKPSNTLRPSGAPTYVPSLNPTKFPTSNPSFAPTTSRQPTEIPSIFPSVQPSIKPSVTPSNQPQCLPSQAPSMIPTSAPLLPSGVPSGVPSTLSSTLPSTLPSMFPSTFPSITPFFLPSFLPTLSPTFVPIMTPTEIPAVIPISSPSVPPLQFISPSFSPSFSPSYDPNHSLSSLIPTCSTLAPVSTLLPSHVSTIKPTLSQTVQTTTVSQVSDPSSEPSLKPSRFPTSKPVSRSPSATSYPSTSVNPLTSSAVPSVPMQSTTLSPTVRIAISSVPIVSANAVSSNTQQPTVTIAISAVVGVLILCMLVTAYFYFMRKRVVSTFLDDAEVGPSKNGVEFQTLYEDDSRPVTSPSLAEPPSRGPATSSNLEPTKPLHEAVQIPWLELSTSRSFISTGVNSDDNSIVGEGSFGFVLKAVWRPKSKASKKAGFMSNVPKEVAIKVLKLSQQGSKGEVFERAVHLVKQEASVMKDAERLVFSDCIAKVYGIVQGAIPDAIAKVLGVRSGTNSVGIVMRYEAGGDLSRYLHFRDTELTLVQKLHLLAGIASGLTELHGAGIIHGDIKPENILLGSEVDPEIRLSDFGLAFMREESSNTASQIFKSSLQHTRHDHARGTPIYSAPEMLFNPIQVQENSSIAKASRKTDVYAFAILAWEIMTQKHPFSSIKSKEQLCWVVHQNIRPPVTDLPHYTPQQVIGMIESCWSKARARRLLASQCYSIVSWHHQQLTQTTFDIFLSHAHTSKPFLSFVYKELTKCGYRVWFDQHRPVIGSSNPSPDNSIIKNCKIFLACVNTVYQKQDSCMAELEEAKLKANKTVVTLVVENEPFVWATARLRDLCSFQSSLFVDVSGSASQDWESESGATPAALDQLRRHMGPLIRLLDESGCKPVYAPRVLTNATPLVDMSSTASSVSVVQSALVMDEEVII